MASTNQIISPPQRQSGMAKNERSDNAAFVICNSCYWCTSLLCGTDVKAFDRCPCCRSDLIEVIPIEPAEEYSFHRNEISGVIMAFRNASEAAEEANKS